MKFPHGSLTRWADHSPKLTFGVASSSQDASANVQHVADETGEMAATIAAVGLQVEEATWREKRFTRPSSAISEWLAWRHQRSGRQPGSAQRSHRQTGFAGLKAAIEASRAGDFGRGFAVIAQEVKSLTTQTAHATLQLSGHIDRIQVATAGSVDTIATLGAIVHLGDRVDRGRRHRAAEGDPARVHRL